jgi:hypothetical protein
MRDRVNALGAILHARSKAGLHGDVCAAEKSISGGHLPDITVIPRPTLQPFQDGFYFAALESALLHHGEHRFESSLGFRQVFDLKPRFPRHVDQADEQLQGDLIALRSTELIKLATPCCRSHARLCLSDLIGLPRPDKDPSLRSIRRPLEILPFGQVDLGDCLLNMFHGRHTESRTGRVNLVLGLNSGRFPIPELDQDSGTGLKAVSTVIMRLEDQNAMRLPELGFPSLRCPLPT